MTSTTSKCVLDSHAWIEYFQGTEAGGKVRHIIETKECFTPTVVMAELADKYSKENRPYFESDADFIAANTAIVELDMETAKNAGKIKQAIRAQYKNNFGLADAIILATARTAGAVVVTGDYHFKRLKNVDYIGR